MTIYYTYVDHNIIYLIVCNKSSLHAPFAFHASFDWGLHFDFFSTYFVILGSPSCKQDLFHLICKYRYTSEVGPRFWGLGVTWGVEMMPQHHGWGWYSPQSLRPLHTSILDTYKVSKPLVCCLKGIWLHPYIVTPAKLAPTWEVRVTCGVEMMPQHQGWGWYLPQTTSYIHIRHIQSVWAIGMVSQGHMSAPIYCYTGTGQVGHKVGDSGSLEVWKHCHKIKAAWGW